MGIIKDIKEALFGPPPGPVYDMGNLKFDYDEYVDHVNKAHDNLFTLMWDKKYYFILCDDGKLNPTELLGRVKYTWTSTIEGWVVDEFIPKITKFRRDSGSLPSTVTNRREMVWEGSNPLLNANRHIGAARVHGEGLVKAIRFFLCDTRSQFDLTASLDEGNATSREISDWYVGGLDIVKRNINRIEEALTSVAKFAEKHYNERANHG